MKRLPKIALASLLLALAICGSAIAGDDDIDAKLIPMDQFLSRYTDEGRVYRGCSFEGLSILLNGGFRFSDRHTAGFGMYTGSRAVTAAEYANSRPSHGAIFVGRVPPNAHLRVISEHDLMNLPEAKILRSKSTEHNIIWKQVGEKYNIDVVIDATGSTVFQKPGLLKLPKDLSENVRWLAEGYVRAENPVDFGFLDRAYERTAREAERTSGGEVPTLEEVKKRVGAIYLKKFDQALDSESRAHALNMLYWAGEELNRNHLEFLIARIPSIDEIHRYNTIEVILSYLPRYPDLPVVPLLVTELKSEVSKERQAEPIPKKRRPWTLPPHKTYKQELVGALASLSETLPVAAAAVHSIVNDPQNQFDDYAIPIPLCSDSSSTMPRKKKTTWRNIDRC